MLVKQIAEALKVTDALTVGEILYARKVYSNLQSARVNAQKKLDKLVAEGLLEKGSGFYRVPGCKSEFKEHAQLITKTLAEVLKLPITSIIHREVVIPEVGLRSDAIVLLTKDNQGLCLILEVMNHEPPEYLQMKLAGIYTFSFKSTQIQHSTL